MNPWPETMVVKMKRMRHVPEKCFRKDCQNFVIAVKRSHSEKGD